MKAEVSARYSLVPNRLSSLMGIIRLYTGPAAVLIYLRNLSIRIECKRYRAGTLRRRGKGRGEMEGGGEKGRIIIRDGDTPARFKLSR